MKNVLILAALCVGLLSCERDYVCECNTVSGTDTNQFHVEYPVSTVKKSQAKQRCQDYQDKLNTSRQLGIGCGLQ